MTPLDHLLNSVTWAEIEKPDDLRPGELYATHTGKLRVGSCVLDVARLSDGQRVITEQSMIRFFGMDSEDEGQE